MSASSSKTPWFKSQWFWAVALVVIGVRFGYKAWRQEQRPDATRMEQLIERSRALQEQLRASQATSTAPVVVADSAVPAVDMATLSR